MKWFKARVLLILIILLAASIDLYRNDAVPVSLFGDELDLGYQALSILKTGKDYSGNFLPFHFRSLADFRTPLYLYSAVPTVALFGISPMGVRLPAAIFGILAVYFLYLLVKKITKNEAISILSAFVLAISPWHIQYSRAGFEATQMLFFLIGGIFFFLKGLENGKWLTLSAVFLAFTPWSYNTSKLFLPLILGALILIWHKDLTRLPKRFLITSVLLFVVVAGPFAADTLIGGGAQRFNYLSIFSNPTLSPEIGFARVRDIQMGGSKISSEFYYNKVFYLANVFTSNYLQSFSTSFLFIKGDPNPRQSIGTIGEFYKFEFPFLIIGLLYLINSKIDKKIKYFLIFWLLTAPIPSSLTVDGGNHATRLILILPILIILIALGIYALYYYLPKLYKKLFGLGLGILVVFNLVFYLHDYWVQYPWDSERWWHAGFKEAISSAVSLGTKYSRVIISDADEPALIYFLGWSAYPPAEFQKSSPLPLVDILGFGQTRRLDKYYFTPQGKEQDMYKLGAILPEDTIYLAAAKEVGSNLIKDPGRVPSDIKLLQAIGYPSGKPAFYIFAKNAKGNAK